MGFMMGKTPSPPPPPPAPPPPPMLPDSGVQKAGADERNLAAMAYGAQQTILTGGQGLRAPAGTTAKRLLGS